MSSGQLLFFPLILYYSPRYAIKLCIIIFFSRHAWHLPQRLLPCWRSHPLLLFRLQNTGNQLNVDPTWHSQALWVIYSCNYMLVYTTSELFMSRSFSSAIYANDYIFVLTHFSPLFMFFN